MSKEQAEREAKLYREVMGHEAAERQIKAAEETCSSCGGRDGRHRPACRSFLYKRRRK